MSPAGPRRVSVELLGIVVRRREREALLMSAPAVLVTGGAGFVGSHACKALARAGYQPVVYDNLSNGIRDAVKWGPLEVGDLEDEARLAEVDVRHKPVGVLHFAAFIEASRPAGQPASTTATALLGSSA
jgi:UDP-glucose 4-epimerase